MTPEDAQSIVSRLEDMTSFRWSPGRRQSWIERIEWSSFAPNVLSRAVDALFDEEEPDKITLSKLFGRARKLPGIPGQMAIAGPPPDPNKPIEWRDPPANYAAAFPLERPNPEWRKKYLESMARKRAEIQPRRPNQETEALMRSALMRIAARWVKEGRSCDFCFSALDIQSIVEYVDWAMTGPPEGTSDRVFCNRCAPRAIEEIDGRVGRC